MPLPLADRGLYAITNGPRPDLLQRAAQALEAGTRLLQYRDKSTDSMRRLAEAKALKALCHAYGALLIINDDVTLTQVVAADGVHLGWDDDDPIAVRAMLGEHTIIGVSCYNELSLARTAVASGADYIAFGAFFPTPIKPLAPRADLELLRQSAALGVPRVAIGGITPDNGGALVQAGADYLAVISAVFDAPDTGAAAQRFTDLYSLSVRETLA